MRQDDIREPANGDGVTTEQLAGAGGTEQSAESGAEQAVYPGEATSGDRAGVYERGRRDTDNGTGPDTGRDTSADAGADADADADADAGADDDAGVGAGVGVDDERAFGRSDRDLEEKRDGEDQPLLDADQAEGFRVSWSEIQGRFVDDPREAVRSADGLVAEVMQTLAASFSSHKQDLEGQWQRGEEVPTEDLRLALQRYRSFFNRLLST